MKNSHRFIREEIEKEKSEISDKDFFTSRKMQEHFEGIAAAQTKRYSGRERVRMDLLFEPEYDDAAHTDNHVITINVAHDEVWGRPDRKTRYSEVMSLFTHELGHCLYTDFTLDARVKEGLKNSTWNPYKRGFVQSMSDEDKTRNDDFWVWLDDPDASVKEQKVGAVFSALHFLENVVEDAYIENRLLDEYPGNLGTALRISRERERKNITPLSGMVSREQSAKDKYMTIVWLVFYYAKFGELVLGDTSVNDERVNVLCGLMDTIDGIFTECPNDRVATSEAIFVRCWDYIKPWLDEEVQKAQNSSGGESGNESGNGSGNGSAADSVSNALKGSGPNVSSGSGDHSGGKPIAGSSASTGTGSETAKRAARSQSARSRVCEANGESQNENGSGGDNPSARPASDGNSTENAGGGSGVPGTGLSDEGDECIVPADEGSDKDSPCNSCKDTGPHDVSPEEGPRPHGHEYRENDRKGNGGIEYNDDFESRGYEKAASDIERILDDMAEERVCTRLEEARTESLLEEARSIDYGDIHNGIYITVNRIAAVTDELKEYYDRVAPDLLKISKLLQKSVKQKLKDVELGGKRTGLVYGRRIQATALSRQDGKVFYKNNLPQDMPQMAIGLLLDESNSMKRCDRVTYARATAVIIYDFCKSLGIPCMIYGHNCTSYYGCDLYAYTEFDAIDDNDKYRLMDINTGGDNRDGVAVRYVCERLSKRHEQVKLFMIVSDGRPNSDNYGGKAAYDELRDLKRQYKRKGVQFVAAAIGDDKDVIEKIYGDSFLDISDLSQMPKKLTDVIKRNLNI